MAETVDQVNSYAPADTDPTNLMEVTDETRIGLHELTITEYTTSTVPEISIGSLIEVNGTLFKVNDTGGGTGMPITVGGVADGTVYVQMIPSGSSPTQILTPTFTATAPTWFDAKQGWYDATGTNRYIHYAMTKATTSYSLKREFPLKNNSVIEFRSGGMVGYSSEVWDETNSSTLVVRQHTMSAIVGVTLATLTNYVAILAFDLTSCQVSSADKSGALHLQPVSDLVHWIEAGTSNICTVSGTLYYLASS